MGIWDVTGEIERSVHLFFANGTRVERHIARLYRESRNGGNQLQLSSFGGTVTTALWGFLEAESPLVQHGSRNRLFKHEWRHSEEVLSGRRKAIYLVGNPILSLMSLDRRFGLRTAGRENQVGYRTRFGRPRSVEEYLEMSERAGRDVLSFGRHVAAWLDAAAKPESRILVVHADTMFEQSDRIAEFAEIPVDRWNTFPEKRERKSSLGDLDSDLIQRLSNILGEALRLVDGIKKMPLTP